MIEEKQLEKAAQWWAQNLKTTGSLKQDNFFAGFHDSSAFGSMGEDVEKDFAKELLLVLKRVCRNVEGHLLTVDYRPCDTILKALRNASISVEGIYLPNKTVMSITNEKIEVSQNNGNFVEIK